MDVPLQTLYEAEGVGGSEMPESLRYLYGGDLGLPDESLFANFVASIDGVVALDDGPVSVVSRSSPADRFVMALLRAFASAVVVGASTLRKEPKGLWTSEYLWPQQAKAFASVRRELGLHPSPQLVVLTRSGEVDPNLAAVQQGALLITTDAGSARLRGRLPKSCRIVSLGGAVEVTDALRLLRTEGHARILTEGGPHVMGQVLQSGELDDLFLTVSPVMLGRAAGRTRLGLVEGAALDPAEAGSSGELLSAKRSGSHLFLRYGLGRRSGSVD
ncbi:MAG: dihydrofolate reductase family protein [Actinomycetota bacterium]